MIGGAAGDMLLAAFLDAGLDRGTLERALRGVVADGWTLDPRRVVKRGIAATYAGLVVPGEDGDEHHHHHATVVRTRHGSFAPHTHIQTRGHASGTRALRATFSRSSKAARSRRVRSNARARGIAAWRKRKRAFTDRPSPTGCVSTKSDKSMRSSMWLARASRSTCWASTTCTVQRGRWATARAVMAHGVYPNPGARGATLDLLRGAPLRATDVEAELVTVTGAAILSTLVATPGERPNMTVGAIGYGAGRRDFHIPNVVRIMIGERTEAAGGATGTGTRSMCSRRTSTTCRRSTTSWPRNGCSRPARSTRG